MAATADLPGAFASLVASGQVPSIAYAVVADADVTVDAIGPAASIGLGWHHKHEVIWHNGMTGGFSAMVAFNQSRRLGIAALTNAAGQPPSPIERRSWTRCPRPPTSVCAPPGDTHLVLEAPRIVMTPLVEGNRAGERDGGRLLNSSRKRCICPQSGQGRGLLMLDRSGPSRTLAPLPAHPALRHRP
jgi:hypothetical protein